MKRKRFFGILGVVAVTLMLVVVGLVLAAPVTIDTFDEGAMSVFAGPPFTAQGARVGDDVTDTAILGIERSVCVTHTSGSSFVAATVDSADDNQFKFGTQSGVLGDACITWDGEDGDPVALDTTGLGAYAPDNDLTDGGDNDGFQILVYETDGDFDLIIRVFTATNASSYTLVLTDDVSAPGQSFFIPFSDFTTVSGTGADFANAGAIQFAVKPQETAVDLTLDLFEASANTDWGDLPENGTSVNGVARYYTTTDTYNGPRHVKGDLYLGGTVDLEADGFPNTSAAGDDGNNFDDEDGIERVTVDDGGSSWESGTGYISATVTGGTGDLYGWFDWNNDGDFDDANEAQSWTNLSAGVHKLTITVNAAFEADDDLFARFRLVENGASAPGYTGEVTNGEVEDYYWGDWGPNAVAVSSVSANGLSLPVIGLVVAVVLGGAGLFVWKRRS